MIIGVSFYNYIDWSFQSLGPWVESNELFPMCIQEISITTLTTKVWEVSVSIPWVLFYLSGPQYLRTLDTSYPVLCMISMTLWTMTPIIITHNKVAPQRLNKHRQKKLILLVVRDRLSVQKLLLLIMLIQILLVPLVIFLLNHPLVPHFPTCSCCSITMTI